MDTFGQVVLILIWSALGTALAYRGVDRLITWHRGRS